MRDGRTDSATVRRALQAALTRPPSATIRKTKDLLRAWIHQGSPRPISAIARTVASSEAADRIRAEVPRRSVRGSGEVETKDGK